MARKKKNHKKTSFWWIFFLFALTAILTVAVLEYIDFHKGKKSFIFSKIIPLEDSTETISQFNKNFLKILKSKKIPHEYFQDEKGKFHFKIDIKQKRFSQFIYTLKKIIKLAKGKLLLFEKQQTSDRTFNLYQIKLKKKITHHILISHSIKPEVKLPEKKPEETFEKKIAFIIDDMGFKDMISLELKKLNIPITASIIPDAPYALEEAKRIHKFGLEEIIHLPMESKNASLRYNKNFFITTESNDNEIRRIIRKSKLTVPFSKGINNHMGSLITSNKEIISRILKIIKKENLYFIDSRTTPETVAYHMAKKLKIRTAFRDIFLDKTENNSHQFTNNQINLLIEKAKQNGKAIAIGHPHPTTFSAIKDSLKRIKANGIKIVFVSKLLD